MPALLSLQAWRLLPRLRGIRHRLSAARPDAAPCRAPRRAVAAHAAAGKRRGGSGSRSTASSTEELHEFFSAQWGDRWPALSAAMAAPGRPVALPNAFLQRPLDDEELPGASSLPLPHDVALPLQPLAWAPPDAQSASSISYPPPGKDAASGLTTHYWLDFASLLPPLALGVRPGDAVLDMCAAPGGKSLVLAQLLFARRQLHQVQPAGRSCGSNGSADSSRRDEELTVQEGAAAAAATAGQLVCNEIEGQRRARLVRVLRDYVPPAVRERHISVTPRDAARHWAHHEEGAFDAVLLDAPCSSDRHILQQAARRADGQVPRGDWNVARCRRLAGEQARLLAAGLRALKPGGRLLYSTCSIAALENDEVVARVLDRAGGAVAVAVDDAGAGCPRAEGALGPAELAALGGERSPGGGWLFLPDSTGWGPIYLCLLEKRGPTGDMRRRKVNKYPRQRLEE